MVLRSVEKEVTWEVAREVAREAVGLEEVVILSSKPAIDSSLMAVRMAEMEICPRGGYHGTISAYYV